MNKPLGDLAYYTEWGGRSWERLTQLAINELQKSDSLNGADLLDIGTRNGKMAVLFSLLGANVTGLDIHEQPLTVAREEAEKRNARNVKFMLYDGNLDIFPDESFDIIFTKSVLVLVPNLEMYLGSISKKLRAGGRVVFLENGKGNALFHACRSIKHREWDYRCTNYFTDKEARLVQSVFHVDTIRTSFYPPIYLFLGRKRA